MGAPRGGRGGGGENESDYFVTERQAGGADEIVVTLLRVK